MEKKIGVGKEIGKSRKRPKGEENEEVKDSVADKVSQGLEVLEQWQKGLLKIFNVRDLHEFCVTGDLKGDDKQKIKEMLLSKNFTDEQKKEFIDSVVSRKGFFLGQCDRAIEDINHIISDFPNDKPKFEKLKVEIEESRQYFQDNLGDLSEEDNKIRNESKASGVGATNNNYFLSLAEAEGRRRNKGRKF